MENQKQKSIIDWNAGKVSIEGSTSLLNDLTKGQRMKWRDAKSERPNHLQRCICYDSHLKEVRCYVYDNQSKYWCSATTEVHDPDGDNHVSDYADYRITHWMLMPEPPKGGEA